MLNVNNNEKYTGTHTQRKTQTGERDKGKRGEKQASGNGKHTGKHY